MHVYMQVHDNINFSLFQAELTDTQFLSKA